MRWWADVGLTIQQHTIVIHCGEPSDGFDRPPTAPESMGSSAADGQAPNAMPSWSTRQAAKPGGKAPPGVLPQYSSKQAASPPNDERLVVVSDFDLRFAQNIQLAHIGLVDPWAVRARFGARLWGRLECATQQGMRPIDRTKGFVMWIDQFGSPPRDRGRLSVADRSTNADGHQRHHRTDMCKPCKVESTWVRQRRTL